MRFAQPWWLFGAALALLVAAFYVLGGIRLLAAFKRFGRPETLNGLLTARAGGRRATKGALVVIGVMLAFFALAGPQYGRGTRLIPATNLDCVIVLDYSKSMYARDIAPNRSERAKAEVARLIAQLPGARFGAVAFAGEPLSFPLSSDGPAIAQFLRQNTPNDMPVGGTAIARALEAARDLLARDPLSAKHQKVILLVTDGEDLEGDPVEVAQAAAKQGILIHVVQVGTRAPEPIPEMSESGSVVGIRATSSGEPLTTSLSARGEEQLAKIAEATGGHIVRAEGGTTGIETIAASLKRMMTEELSEQVETVYADVYHYPLGLALLLLLIEAFIPTAPRRSRAKLLTAALALFSLAGCERLERALFERYSPDVDRAIQAIETSDAGDAETILSDYLNTGKCQQGDIGTPERIRELPQATLNLGLALFQLAERFGGRFGQPPADSSDPDVSRNLAARSQEVDCALRLVRVLARDESLSIEQRAEAFFLSGNLEFLRHEYRSAVDSYDDALRLLPGDIQDAGPSIGADAAFNRAIALRRIAEEEEQEEDRPEPPAGDAGSPQDPDDSDQQDEQEQSDQDQQDQQQDQEQEQSDQGQQDQNQDQEQSDQEQNQPEQAQPEEEQAQPSDDPEPPPQASPGSTAAPPSLAQDERMLQQLEQAPNFQQAVLEKRRGRVRPNMEDK